MDTIKGQEWRYREEDVELAGIIAGRLEIEPLLSRMMVARGICDPEEIYDILHPSLRQLHDPFMFRGMDKAVKRIGEAMEAGEGICIHGDYDVDGITSTALIRSALEGVGDDGKLRLFLPSRFEEGYGISKSCIEDMEKRGDTLMITVDCGIKANSAIETAVERGIDTILTDHHEPGKEIPEAYAVLDPKVGDSGYPFRELAGVGVAFKLATALQMKGVVGVDVRDLMDLVALGTVSDLVPLVEENRPMVHFGLEELAGTKRVGLLALMRDAGVDSGKGVRSSDIAYKLGPRLNAAGRLAHPGMALDLILTEDRVDADLFSRELNTLNFKRQAIGRKLVEDIMEEIERLGLTDAPAIVVGGEGWNPGVIGVSAAMIVEMTGKPTVAVAIIEGKARGSARAPRGFNMIEALDSVSDILVEYGGHKRAAGLELMAKDLQELRRRLISYVEKNYPDSNFVPVLEIDLDLTLPELEMESVRSLEKLGPFGMGNPQPMISLREVAIGYDAQAVGGGKHLRFSVTDGDKTVGCIWFNKGELAPDLHPGTMVTVAGLPDIHRWMGSEDVQIRVNDLYLLE